MLEFYGTEMHSYIDFHSKTQAKTMAQRPVQQVAQQRGDEDNDEDDLANNNSSVSGTASIGLASGRARRPTSPLVICLLTDYAQLSKFFVCLMLILLMNVILTCNFKCAISQFIPIRVNHHLHVPHQALKPLYLSTL